MAYDLEEQEQLDTLKATWKQYGNLITWTLIAALGSYAGWVQWNNYQRNQSGQASQLFEELSKSVAAKDAQKIQRVAADMKEKYPSTNYAAMAALTTAKAAYEASDLKTAKANLQWVIDSGKNEEYKALAKIRLAGVLLDEKAYEEALKVLSVEFPAELQAEVADRKADILVAQGNTAEAKKSYQLALDKMTDKSPAKQMVQLKLDALGGAVAQDKQ
ncbi:YfgM family protein [Undibacterium rugosum]|uniref:YfgM family protein n=1 Tax=Undibacterium rugosum TaxID=2762291 RepID=UPI001B8139D9|nr:tetratricopeptide repeat protein [Undibacterium rugosum]MBR7778196.1 tetratricopeptide repeat protein [Undibacterium rugosum]